MRAWERVLRRARVPVAYSQGYNPRPRLALAAPLPVGFTSGGELMDLFLSRYVSPFSFSTKLGSQLPFGLAVVGVEEVYLGLPSLQSQVRFSEYRITLSSQETSPYQLGERLQALLSAEEIVHERRRQDKVKVFDLRPMVEDIWIQEIRQDEYDVTMQLQTDSQATGRPDDVLQVLGLSDSVLSIHRVRLLLRSELKGERT
jgi:radical SAM-linked protein